MDHLDRAADDGGDGGQPPKKKLSQAQIEARRDALKRAREKKRKRKGGGGTKGGGISRRIDGADRKSGSYNYAEAAAAVGVEKPNSQAIKSRLMPVAAPRPRKPTPRELEDSIKEKEKEVKQLHKKVEKTEAKYEATVGKLKLSEENVAKLKQLLQRKKSQVIELSDKLKEEKKHGRLLLAKVCFLDNRAEDMGNALRGRQSDLIAVKRSAEMRLKEARVEYEKEIDTLKKDNDYEKRSASRAAVRIAMEQSKAKLDKKKEEFDATEKSLQNLLTQYKSEAKQRYKNSMNDLDNVEKQIRSKLSRLEQTHASETAAVKEESRRSLQEMSAKTRAKIDKLKEKVKELKSINLELEHNATEERRARRKVQKNADKIAKMAALRLDRMKSAQAKCEELREENEELREEVDSMAKVLEENELVIKECSKIKDSDGRGGLSWPPWMILYILEFLANGTSPTAIPDNIRSAYWTLYSKGPKEVPSVDFCRKCRTIADRFNECLVGILIARHKWKTTHTDGTNRRQTAYETLVLGLDDDEGKEALRNIIVSSCIFMESQDAESCVDGITRKLDQVKHVLKRVRETMSENGDNPDDFGVPKPEDINMEKLGENHGAVITDTCNHARKEQQILQQKIGGETHDCFNHMRCVVNKNCLIGLNEFTSDFLKDYLDLIAPILRVSTSLDALLIAFDKEFSLCANYPKGHGELFLTWLRTKYPDELLFHVARSGGGRQDLALMASLPIYWNRELCTEFLDERLRVPGNENILQRNLFTVLTSAEMVAVARLLAIMHISINMPLRFLIGKTHEWYSHGWGVVELGEALDCWYDAMIHLKDHPEDYLDQDFMLSIFDRIKTKLPPLDDYLKFMFDEKVTKSLGNKGVLLSKLRDELFDPQLEANKQSADFLLKFVPIVVEAAIKEMTDEKKAIHRYVSANGEDKACYSFKHASDERRKALLRVPATNDNAESSLATNTYELQKYGRILIKHAAAISDIKRNGFLVRGNMNEKTKDKLKRKPGLAFSLPNEVVLAVIQSCQRDRKEQHKRNTAELEAQREASAAKEKLIHEHNLHNATEKYIDAMYYYKMFHSPACLKNYTAQELKDYIAKLPSKSRKLEVLKENIRMRKIGLGWTHIDDSWSKGGNPHSVGTLTTRLLRIITMEGAEDGPWKIPPHPPICTPSRTHTVALGTRTKNVESLDEKYLGDENKIRKEAIQLLKQRETRGEGSLAAECQEALPPKLQSIVGERIELLVGVDVGGQTELLWWGGKVLHVEDEEKRQVTVSWDPLDDVSGWEEGGCSIQKLAERKWNKNTQGAWRMEYIDELGDLLSD